MERRETPFCDVQVNPQHLTQHVVNQNNTVFNHILLLFPTLTRPHSFSRSDSDPWLGVNRRVSSVSFTLGLQYNKCEQLITKQRQ